jgi:hypothetical protein
MVVATDEQGGDNKNSSTHSFFLRRHSLAASRFFSKRLAFFPSPPPPLPPLGGEGGSAADGGDVYPAEYRDCVTGEATRGEVCERAPAATAAVSCLAVDCNFSGSEMGPVLGFLDRDELLRRRCPVVEAGVPPLLPTTAAAAGAALEAPAASRSSCIPLADVRDPPDL